MTVKRVTAVSLFLASNAAIKIGITFWLADNRAKIVKAIAGMKFDTVHNMFADLCERWPAARGVVTMLCADDVDEAIQSIREVDQVLGDSLERYRPKFEKFLIELRANFPKQEQHENGSQGTGA